MISLLAPLVACALAQESRPLVAPDQIAWQRSLEDARAIAAAQKRPLLVAINVDGESGSDRIVREEYRDPEFVTWTRRFVCVIGHPYRHTPRDHDERGRRIPCPRLGSVTCGEHVALEPALFDAYLGGERVSPRHALILPDGSKTFDLYYQFDITVLDDAVRQAAGLAPPDATEVPWFSVHDEDDAFLDALAGARASWQRELFEQFQREDASPATTAAFVRAIGRAGNAGSVEALLPILRDRTVPAEILGEVARGAEARGFARDLGSALRAAIAGAGRYPGAAALGADRHLLPVVARLAGSEAPVRALLVAQAAIGHVRDRAMAEVALGLAFPAEEAARIGAEIAAEGGPVDVEDLLRLGAELHAAIPARAPRTPEPARSAEELVAELEAAERGLSGNESDARAARAFGLANLRLAQARIASSGPDVGLLLQDADTWLARAAATRPEDEALAVERARTAYLLSRHEDQSRIAGNLVTRVRARLSPTVEARAVLAGFDRFGSGSPAGRAEVERAAAIVEDALALEALRWLGDAEGRRIGQSGGDRAREAAGLARGARALATVCASPDAEEVDFQSLASFLRAAGLARPSLATLRSGLLRFPESGVLRDLLRDVLAQCGRPDALVRESEWLAARAPESGAGAWYAGYAHFLAAEWARRGEDPESALAEYAAAEASFRRSLELQPAYADSAGHYLAAAQLGRGFALRLAGREQDAADALVRALALRPAIGGVRDGLDREAVDLVDGVLEWTAVRPSRVHVTAFADALSRAVPGETRWLLAVSDAALREGLRADGRVRARIPLLEALRVAGQPDTVAEPSAEGDRWLDESIEIARRASAISDDATTRRQLAQSLTVQAERRLVRDRADDALPLLDEAARILEEPAQAGESPVDVARRLRARLGEARPIARPGR